MRCVLSGRSYVVMSQISVRLSGPVKEATCEAPGKDAIFPCPGAMWPQLQIYPKIWKGITKAQLNIIP